MTRALLTGLPVNLAIAASVVLIEPVEVAAINWEEISLGFDDVVVRSAVPFLVVVLALTLLSTLATLVVGLPRAVALFVGLLVSLAVQANVFLWSYGVFDGSSIDWFAHRGKGVFELGVWVALLGLAVWRSDAVFRARHLVTGLALAAQLIGAAATLYSHAPYAARAEYEASERSVDAFQMARFSETSNVLVIVLDAFQSDFFAELLDDPSIARAVPPGFTYYRNAVSHYPGTMFSLQSILTSSLVSRPVRRVLWQLEQMERSVPARLASEGYTSSLLTNAMFHLVCGHGRFGYACLSHRAYLQQLARRDTADWEGEDDLRSIRNLSLFRSSPHFVKPWVYAGGDWILSEVDMPTDASAPELWPRTRRDLEILRELTRSARAEAVPPTFKFLHFHGAHHPASTARDCRWNGLDNPSDKDRNLSIFRDRRYVVDSAACALGRVFGLLARLDEIGVYDDSLIFVVADHGNPNKPIDAASADPPIPADVRPPPLAPGRVRMRQSAKGVPLFLVKRAGERHALRITDAPVALCDVPKSIFRELGIESDYGCDSIFDESRTSRRFHFVARSGGNFDRYVVDPHSWFPDSWLRWQPTEDERH